MTGTGNHTIYKNGDDWRMVHYCFTHIIIIIIPSGNLTYGKWPIEKDDV